MDRCELCQKELVPFSFRAPYGSGVICGSCAEKQKAAKSEPAKAAAPAAPQKPEVKAEAPAAPAAKVVSPKKPEGGEDDLSSALDSLLN